MNAELRKLEKEKQIAVSHNKWKEAADHCNYIGSELCRLGEHEEALQFHNEELSYNDMIGDRLGSAVANRRIGECYSQMNNFGKALFHIEVFKKIAVELGNTVEEQRAWATFGRTFYLKYLFKSESVDLNKAESSYRRALELAEKLKSALNEKEFAEMKARCLLNLGLVYELRGDIQKCGKCIQNAIYLASKFSLHEDLNRCQSSLASVYQKHEQYALALQLMDGAIASAKKLRDKTLLCYELSTKATLLISMKDFDRAKHCLKKAYKLHSPVKEDHENVTKALKICVGLCVFQNKLQEIDIDDSHERKVLLEKIADGLSSSECYKLAIEFYLLTLQCMEVEGSDFTMSQKAPIYFSIAMTYKDMGDIDMTLKYLKEEMMCNEDNPSEQIKTLWKIIEVLEEEQNVSEAEKYHLKAVSISQKVEKKKLQFRALTKLCDFYKQNKAMQKADEIHKKLEHRSFQDLSSDESDVEEESQDPFKDIHLSELSDEKAEVDKAVSTRPKRQSKKPGIKRNAKGETPLHTACIEGKFNEVRKLVECGHSLTVTDFGGWMPLHEASNHGYYDIVEYLLDKGAPINNRGGSGITALHDAAFNGNLDVVQLLISRGASVTVLDDDGNTPLRALLTWKKSANLDAVTLRICEKIEEELRSKMLQAGQPAKDNEIDEVPENFLEDYDDEPIEPSRERVSEKRSRPSSSSEERSEDSEESIEKFTPQPGIETDHPSHLDTGTKAQSEYQAVMSNLRRSAQSVLSEPKVIPKKAEKKLGLVAEEEVINDWLVWDTKQLTKPQRKRRKVPRLNVRTSKSLYNYYEPKDAAEFSPSDEKEECFIEEDSNDSPQTVKSSDPLQKSTKDISIENLSISNRTTNTPNLPFWLRVWIGDKCIHVPVPEDSHSIEWLAEEASNRYQSEYLSKPYLTSLMKIDGAMLLSTDKIKCSLAHNEEIKSTVMKWDEPTLEERYIHLCKKQKLVPLKLIQEELVKFNKSCEINFSHRSIDSEQINLIFQSLSYHKKISHLYFNGTMLVSSNMAQIISCFPSFVSLVTLNLSTCALFTNTLRQIAEYLDHQTSPENRFPCLKSLHLNYNLFCSPCSSYISTILQIPSLTTLGLNNCDLYPMTFEDLKLCDTLEGCRNLQEINIAGNLLTDQSMKNFLNHLPKSNLVKLDMAYTAEQCPNFSKNLKNSITGEFPKLAELSLERCNLTDQDLLQFTPAQFIGLPNLKAIDLSCNSKLSAGAIAHFLKVASNGERPLEVLLGGTGKWDIQSVTEFIDQIDFRCLSSVIFENISKEGREELFKWWKNCWNDKAQCINSIVCKICLL